MKAKPMDENARGKFTLNLNYRRRSNQDAPDITGRISTPEAPDETYNFEAWKHDSEKGPYWIGSVNPIRSMRQALTSAEPAKGTHFISIRLNGFKVFKTLDNGESNPDYAALPQDAQALEDKKPSFWATWTRDPATNPEIRCAAWDREPTRYGPWASGTTQYPLKNGELENVVDQDVPFDLPKAPQAPEPTTKRAKGDRDSR